MNKKGFTLIEILTVIIILGVIMIIAVPAVSKYILGSRDSAYVTSIEKYIEAARNEVTDFEYIVSRDDTTYYIPTKCLKVENGENSPYGEMQESYVVVTTNNLGKHKYYYLGRDETNHGMTLTPSDEVDTDHLSSEVTIIDKTQMLDGTTRVAVYKDDCSKQTESTTNTSLANCGTVTGESDVWTKEDRTITVACVGNCMNPSYTNVFRATKKEGIIQITDRENNVKNCRVKVYVDKTIPVVGLRGIKKNSGTLVASETWSNEGLNYMFVYQVMPPSGSTIYYCQDLNNTCTPNKLARPGETIIGYNNLTGIYYIRYKAISGVGLESKVASYKAQVDIEKPTCTLKTSGTMNTPETVYLADVLVEFEGTNDTGGSGVKDYGIGSINGEKQVTHSDNSSSTVTYTGYIEDKAGNQNTCSVEFIKNNELTLTYDNHNGSGCTSKTVTYNGTYGDLCVPTRSGYTFAGWYTQATGGGKVESTTTVTARDNHTIHAHWTPKNYVVTFDVNGGNLWTSTTCSSPSVFSSSNVRCTKTVTRDSSYGTLPTSSRTGYTFVGWYTASSGGSQITASSIVDISTDKTYYAHWNVNTYTLTYNNQSGAGCTSKTATYGNSWGALCTPTRSNYRFDGWFTAPNGGGEQITASSIANRNLTVYAKWTVIRCDLRYNNICYKEIGISSWNSKGQWYCVKDANGIVKDSWFAYEWDCIRLNNEVLSTEHCTAPYGPNALAHGYVEGENYGPTGTTNDCGKANNVKLRACRCYVPA